MMENGENSASRGDQGPPAAAISVFHLTSWFATSCLLSNGSLGFFAEKPHGDTNIYLVSLLDEFLRKT